VAIYETGGFSKAAKRCFVSQPSLSQQIIKLERECGGKLFDRLKKKVVPTELGRVLYPQARTVLEGLEKIRRTVVEPEEVNTDQLRVGILPTIAPHILPATIESFRENYAHIHLSIVEDMTDNLLDALHHTEIDVAIMSLPIESKHVRHELLYQEPFVVLLPSNHELTKRKEISVEEIKSYPFIALDPRHCLGEQVESFCYTAQINPVIICKTAQVTTIQDCVSRNLGIAMVPSLVAHFDKDRSRTYRPLKSHQPSRPIVAAYLKSRSEIKSAMLFVDTLKALALSALENPKLGH